MPRGDGKKSGEPRGKRVFPESKQYVPKRLRGRLNDYEFGLSMKKPDTEMHKPGSQK